MSAHARVALGIAQVPEGRQVFAPLSVEDNLRLGAWRRRRERLDAELAGVYELFPTLASRRRVSAGTLSGGEQQMLAIGRALMARPRLLLLDEPSMGLAPMLVEQILDVVRRLKQGGLTVLLVEQNARAALAIADRGYVVETGRIATSGSAGELLADDRCGPPTSEYDARQAPRGVEAARERVLGPWQTTGWGTISRVPVCYRDPWPRGAGGVSCRDAARRFRPGRGARRVT